MNPRSLKTYNTFGIAAQASDFIEVHSTDQLIRLLSEKKDDYFVLGGGSNMLLCSDIQQTVLYINNQGKQIVQQDEQTAVIEFQAGENWHQAVMYCVAHEFGGIENLALIPGKIGAAPIQNIGAYGVELKDVFVYCDAVHIESAEVKRFHIEDCAFGYRDSVFKNELKGEYIITAVALRLTKNNHQLNTSYGAIEAELEKMDQEAP